MREKGSSFGDRFVEAQNNVCDRSPRGEFQRIEGPVRRGAAHREEFLRLAGKTLEGGLLLGFQVQQRFCLRNRWLARGREAEGLSQSCGGISSSGFDGSSREMAGRFDQSRIVHQNKCLQRRIRPGSMDDARLAS